MRITSSRLTPRQAGVSLIELMISLVVGTFVLAALLYVYSGSRTTARHTDAMSRLQENGRIAIDVLAFETRMAGYNGCGKLVPTAIMAKDAPFTVADIGIAVEGYTYSSGSPAFVDSGSNKGVEGSDVLLLRKGSSDLARLTGNVDPDNANIQVFSNHTGFKKDDLLIVSDCETADLFRATSVSNSADKVTIAHASTGNIRPKLSKAYGVDADVMVFQVEEYFLRASGRTNQAGNPIVSLFRRRNGAAAEELVEGVADLRIRYGLDFPNTDGAVDNYVDRAGVGVNWNRVLAVRLELLLESVEDNVITDAHGYSFNGDTVEAEDVPDRKLRDVFTTTIALRNRLK